MKKKSEYYQSRNLSIDNATIMNNADQPAFPGSYKGATQGIEVIDFVPGMTKRELIAAIIMGKSTPTNDALEVLNLTRIAIFSADALLQQLETIKPKP